MPLNFDKYAAKGNKFLEELAKELGDKTDTARAGRILQALFHTLRDHLTLEENFQLMAQLPMALKSLYVQGWSPSKKRKVSRKKKGFVEEFMSYEGVNSWRDFSSTGEGVMAIRAVIKILRGYVTYGEWKDIDAVLTPQIRELLREDLVYKKLSLSLVKEE